MKILILGGTGFISSRITGKLLERGHKITLFNRGKRKSDLLHENLDIINGSRNNKRDLEEAAESGVYDVVYDMIAYEPQETKNAVEVFRNQIGRFIHCSTISVYMISNDVVLPVTEDQDKAPVMDYFPRNPFGMQYGIDKRGCEDILWQNHNKKSFPVTVIRPTFVSGPHDPAKRDYFWIQRILDGKPLLVPGTGNHRFQQIFVNDCAEIFCKVIENDISIGEAYNAVAEEAFTLDEYLNKLAHLLNREIEIVHMDQNEFDKLNISTSARGDVFPFNARRDAVFSLAKVKHHLGYRSSPFEKWMTETINWFINNYKKSSIGYEYREEELRIIESLRKRK